MNPLTRMLFALVAVLIAMCVVKLLPRFRSLPFASVLVLALAALTGALPAATLLVNSGRAILTNLASGLGGTVPRYLAIGTGATTFTAVSTTVSTEVETRGTGTPTRTTTSTANDTLTIVATVTATAPRTVTNLGFFDASTSGNLFVGVDGLAIGLATADSLQITLNAAVS
jgi:hypothetical protein